MTAWADDTSGRTAISFFGQIAVAVLATTLIANNSEAGGLGLCDERVPDAFGRVGVQKLGSHCVEVGEVSPDVQPANYETILYSVNGPVATIQLTEVRRRLDASGHQRWRQAAPCKEALPRALCDISIRLPIKDPEK